VLRELDEPAINNYRKLSIQDLLTATAVSAVVLALALSAWRIVSDPNKFVASLGYQTAGPMMLVCTIGIVGFPTIILTVGFLVLRKVDSPLMLFYRLLVIGLAIASIPLTFIVGRACAYAIA
jgi:hypothetical protein